MNFAMPTEVYGNYLVGSKLKVIVITVVCNWEKLILNYISEIILLSSIPLRYLNYSIAAIFTKWIKLS